MITERLEQLVNEEALNLKKYATKEEIEKLDFTKLDPQDHRLCIYGQMTGHCANKRSIELQNKCTTPYSQDTESIHPPSRSNFVNIVLGKEWSPIEFYICQKGAKIEELINLIKS